MQPLSPQTFPGSKKRRLLRQDRDRSGAGQMHTGGETGVGRVAGDAADVALAGWTSRTSEVAQSCPALCDPMDCSLSGSSIHGIFQARVLEWTAIIFSVYFHVEYHNLLLKKILYC